MGNRQSRQWFEAVGLADILAGGEEMSFGLDHAR
jgi:hypothetical protein